MRIVTWNMGCGPRSRYRRTNLEAWRYLIEALEPDIAFVQEALFASTPSPREGTTLWSTQQGTDSGTALFIRTGWSARQLVIRSQGSYIAAADLADDTEDRLFASIHVGPGDYHRNRRALLESIIPATAGRRFVFGGDLNAARHWDAVYGGRRHRLFFKALEDAGCHDCHWARHGREVQSFWGHQTREAYQCDHLFTDAVTAVLVEDCVVIDTPEARRLSDHGPVLLILRDGLAKSGE